MSEIGIVKQVDINQELEEAYLSYAMSVIVSRALPDARDGLKPVHRRILYAMYDMGLHPNRPHKKSARIVGEVLGKYHPHGDSAVYDAMVRMAQDFSMRYPLVDGQGNFGSVDGDRAAAMRYTEARLTKAAMELLTEINKNTVNFSENFDGSLKEPNVLPTELPNLLVNGSDGIAVGMSTKIPPHNIGEICDALEYMLEHWEQLEDIGVEDLMRFVKGPDFPTGGLIYRYRNDGKHNNTDTILNAYGQGRGRIVVQAKTHVEEMSRNRSRIVITELPYQTNKANLIGRIAHLVRDGKVEGITDMRDESDRRGMRIVIETTRNVKPRELLGLLFKYTPLRQTFGVIMLALVNGRPRLLSLKRCLQIFIEHRHEVIRRRSEYDLERALTRAHILEGLRVALKNLDEVVQTIRRSRRTDTAKKNLMKRFGMTEKQAQAVLDMRLARLAALERKKIETEYKAIQEQINQLEELLATPELVLTVIRRELKALKERYQDERRTTIITEAEYTGKMVQEESLIPDGDIILTISRKNEIQRIMNTARKVRSGAKYSHIMIANNRHDLLLINQDGRAWRTEIHLLPEKTGRRKGESLTQRLSKWQRSDRAVAALDLPKEEEALTKAYLIVATRAGRVMRLSGGEIKNLHTATQLINLDEGDEVVWSALSLGEDHLILVSRQGQAICFSEQDIRPTSIGVQGVWGMKLEENDGIVGAALTREGKQLLIVSSKGMSKRTPLDDFSPQKRYGKGLKAMNLDERTGTVAVATIVEVTDKVTLFTTQKKICFDLQVRDIAEGNRYDSGQAIGEFPSNLQITNLLKWREGSAWPQPSACAKEEPSPEAEVTTNKKAKRSRKSRKRRKRTRRTKGQLSFNLGVNGSEAPVTNGSKGQKASTKHKEKVR